MIYINDITEGLTTNTKLFAADTCSFSIVHDTQISANDLYKHLEIINKWDFKRKMNFIQTLLNKIKEHFSLKEKGIYHPRLVFNNSNVSQTPSQK